jgi:hypothetical protein
MASICINKLISFLASVLIVVITSSILNCRCALIVTSKRFHYDSSESLLTLTISNTPGFPFFFLVTVI